MTKAEELKVLEQVRNLISGTELVKKAFEGVLEIAEENISCDFWLSFPDKLEYERNKLEQTEKDFSEYRASTDKVIDDMDKELTAWKQRYSDMSGIADRNAESADEWEKNAHDAGELYCELEKECAEKDAEIMRLKAEIYDLRKECGK